MAGQQVPHKWARRVRTEDGNLSGLAQSSSILVYQLMDYLYVYININTHILAYLIVCIDISYDICWNLMVSWYLLGSCGILSYLMISYEILCIYVSYVSVYLSMFCVYVVYRCFVSMFCMYVLYLSMHLCIHVSKYPCSIYLYSYLSMYLYMQTLYMKLKLCT